MDLENIKVTWNSYPSIKKRLKDKEITQRDIAQKLWSIGIDVDPMTVNRCLNTHQVEVINTVAEQLIVERTK